MIRVETATVYRGGGRRWFSVWSACHAEAKALHKAHFRERCDCGSAEPEFGDAGSTCQYHEQAFYTRFVGRVARLLRRAMP